jgi:hypothetical protein
MRKISNNIVKPHASGPDGETTAVIDDKSGSS